MSLILRQTDTPEIGKSTCEVPASLGEVLIGSYGSLRAIMSAHEWPMGVQSAFEGMRMASAMHKTLGQMALRESAPSSNLEEDLIPAAPSYGSAAVLRARSEAITSSIRRQYLNTSSND